jgi:hypothetical protein
VKRCIFGLCALSLQKYTTGCMLPVNKQYVDTGSKYRGSGIVSHGERVSDAKDVNWNKNESTRNLWRPR